MLYSCALMSLHLGDGASGGNISIIAGAGLQRGGGVQILSQRGVVTSEAGMLYLSQVLGHARGL